MFSFTLSSKVIPDLEKFHELVAATNSDFVGFTVTDGVVTVHLSTPPNSTLITAIESVTPPSIPVAEIVKAAIQAAMIFGQGMIVDEATKNVMLGITAAGKTSAVRTSLRKVVNCLQTGSLYDAISELRAIPVEERDAVFLSSARILQGMNKIETYLGLPLSTTSV